MSTVRAKFPSIPYSVFSPSKATGDRVITNPDFTKQSLILEKMDGENTTFYHDYYHARSIDSMFHPSRSWIARHHGMVKHLIDPDIRIIIENVYAEHSIQYNDLESFGYVICVMRNDTVLSWEDTQLWAEIINLPTVPVIYQGMLNQKIINDVINNLDITRHEGFVVRPVEEFKNVSENMWKWVRKCHVQTDEHWKNNWSPNKMK